MEYFMRLDSSFDVARVKEGKYLCTLYKSQNSQGSASVSNPYSVRIMSFAVRTLYVTQDPNYWITTGNICTNVAADTLYIPLERSTSDAAIFRETLQFC